MIAGLVQILLFQGLGEIVARFFLPLIPGPAIGHSMRLARPRIRGGVPASVDLVATIAVTAMVLPSFGQPHVSGKEHLDRGLRREPIALLG